MEEGGAGSRLPNELVLLWMVKVRDATAICRAACVNKQWNSVSMDDSIWIPIAKDLNIPVDESWLRGPMEVRQLVKEVAYGKRYLKDHKEDLIRMVAEHKCGHPRLKIDPPAPTNHVGFNQIRAGCIGSGGSGRQTAILSYKQGKFVEDAWTVEEGVNCRLDSRDVQLLLEVDRPGNDAELFRQIPWGRMEVFILFFSLVNRDSFNRARDYWFPETQRLFPEKPLVLAGTKLDMLSPGNISDDGIAALGRLSVKGQSPVSFQEGVDLAEQIGALAFISFSSKTGDNLPKLMEETCKAYMLGRDVAREQLQALKNTNKDKKGKKKGSKKGKKEKKDKNCICT